jgi:predicted dehydrogenase
MKNIESVPNAAELPRIAVVGCGAAAREFYLPVLRKYAGFQSSVVLVDHVRQRAESMATEFGIQHCRTDFRALPFMVDAAIITTPHHLHAEQSIHFLKQGRHVFVEKPLGMTAAEVEAMLDAASQGEAALMVNNYRRLFPAYQHVRKLMRSGELGMVRRITIQDGTKFAWNSASSFYLRDLRARGVFLDRGAHTVDILCWWLGHSPRVVDARYDARDGIEGLMDVTLASHEATLELKFSRFHRLDNSYIIECEHARIEGRLFDFSRLCVRRDGHPDWIDAGKARPHHAYAWQLVQNFIGVIQGRESPMFLAADVAPSIAVIEQAYRLARRFDLPWYERDPNVAFLKDDFLLNHPRECMG